MSSRAFAAGLTLSLSLVLFPQHVRAEGSSTEKAAAEALFREAMSLIEQNQIGPACDKFAASQAIDPTVGTMLRLADCYDRAGKTASAWAMFEQAASVSRAANQPERERIAAERGKELEARLSKVVIQLVGSAPQGLEVRLNDSVIPNASIGTALPVDPGALNVEMSAEGYEPFAKRFEIAMGPSSTTLELPLLEPLSKSEVAPAAAPATAAPVAATTEPAPGASQRTLGYVAGGLGLAGVIASGVLGYRAYDLNESSLDQCLNEDANACNADGKTQRDDARRFGNFATVTGVAGGALLAASVVLFITAPLSEPTRAVSAQTWIAPYVSGREARVEAGGRF